MQRIRFVFGVLPVFYAKSRDNWGHQRGPVVFLPKSYGEALLRHEIFHVKQWYLTFGLMSFLMLFRHFRFRFEAAAYGESLRYGGGSAAYYARALASDHYRLKKTFIQCHAQITARQVDKKLF